VDEFSDKLLGQSSDPLRYALFEGFEEVVQLFIEHHVPSRELAGHDHLAEFGLTDLGILDLAKKERSLVLTADSRLAAYLGSAGVDAIDYHWVKEQE
jgi:hypothetical protein